MSKFNMRWTLSPVILTALYFLVIYAFGPKNGTSDASLLIEQVVLSIVLITAILWARRPHHAGWNKRLGYSWIWIAGPLWLVILSPIGLALTNISANTQNALLWISASLFIGINEETLFRGLMLNGLRTIKGPMWSAILSSLAFGLLHSINGLFGADPVFLFAQIIVAFGTGLVLCAVTLRAGSIWPAVFLHFAGDAVGLSALGGFQNAIETNEAAMGMLILGLISTVWGLGWLWRILKKGTFTPFTFSVK